MAQTIKILHIDPAYKVTYFIYRPGSSIQTSVPLAEAVNLLKTIDFDLIMDEPNQHAILNRAVDPKSLERFRLLN